MRQRIELAASIVVVALAVASFALAFYSPIYTDEIGWKLIQGHFVDDGFSSRSTTLAPTCGPDTFLTPALLVPLRYVDAYLAGFLNQPRDIRLYGLFTFLMWAGATWWLLFRRLTPAIRARELAAGVVATATLGVMPLFLVISRPEQVMLIGMSTFLILAVDERPQQPRRTSLLRDASLACIMIFGGIFVLGSHPRAILILPVAIFACLRVVRHRAISLSACAVLIAFAIVAFVDFSARLACPADTTIHDKLTFESVGIAMAHHALPEYFHALAGVLVGHPGAFFFLTQFGFNDRYVSDMIPPFPFKGLGIALTGLMAEFVGVLVVVGIGAFVLGALSTIRKRRISVAFAALASGWAFLLVSLVARVTRNDYEAELTEPLMVLVSFLSLWFAREELEHRLGAQRLARYSRAGFAGLIGLSIVSQLALLAGYVPAAHHSWSRAGYVSQQPFSVSTSGFSDLRDRIGAVASRCNIKAGPGTQNLVVDELTYFAFRHTKVPYLMLYLYPHMWAGDLNLRAFLASRHSSGIIVGCQWLPPGLKSAVQTNGFCCFPKF